MGILREIPPTAGFKMGLRDFLRLHPPGSLEGDFRRYLQLPYAAVTYSGTAALYFILETMKKLSPKKTVVIPSFVCPLVALAIVRAGLKIKVCDIKPDRFDFEEGQLKNICQKDEDILAVIAVHLAGIPVDLRGIGEIIQKQNIFLIEDCAQALGAESKGKKVGTFGDFAFFSLCRGKGLTIYEGGVLVTPHAHHIPLLQETIKNLQSQNFLSESLKILELFGYAVFYRPCLFWSVFRLPQKFWQSQGDQIRAMGEYYTTDFDIHCVSHFRKKLGHVLFLRLDREIAQQRQKAQFYFKHLQQPGLDMIQESVGSKAVYPYVSIIIKDLKKRQKIFRRLQKEGLGSSIIYVTTIDDYPYLKNVIAPQQNPHGRYLASHTLTLSTSTFLTEKDLLRITQCF